MRGRVAPAGLRRAERRQDEGGAAATTSPRPARDQAQRIGSLFLNPGGPDGSGTVLARLAPGLFSPALLEGFDIVGFDPRGTNFSDQVKCFTSAAEQTRALKGFEVGFPMGKVEERAFVASARSLGAGCWNTGRPLSASMSTAEVARDMEVLRRAVGDSKLTYLGFSYGTYLGQVYANMFPDRVRGVAIDGVMDPVAWAGTPATASRPQEDRLRSADGASKALLQLLRLCDQAGEQRCKFAPGDPVANFDLLANRLKKLALVRCSHRGFAAAQQPPGQQRQLGTHRLRHVPMRHLRHRHLPAHPGGAGTWHEVPRRRAALPGQPRHPDRPAELTPVDEDGWPHCCLHEPQAEQHINGELGHNLCLTQIGLY